MVECACVHVCMPGGRREVLAASLGTYKPCGRICLRCQLKAFSNVYPAPSPGMGEARTQSCLLLTSPPAWPGGTAGACTTLFPGPASPLVGLSGREGRQQLPHLLPPWGKAKNPVPSRPPFCNCYRNRHKMGQPWLCLVPVPCTYTCFSCNYLRQQQ